MKPLKTIVKELSPTNLKKFKMIIEKNENQEPDKKQRTFLKVIAKEERVRKQKKSQRNYKKGIILLQLKRR